MLKGHAPLLGQKWQRKIFKRSVLASAILIGLRQLTQLNNSACIELRVTRLS